MLDSQILVVIIISKCLFFSRKTSPDHIPGDAEGAESRVRLQEAHASGSLNGKLVSQEGKIAPDWCKMPLKFK